MLVDGSTRCKYNAAILSLLRRLPDAFLNRSESTGSRTMLMVAATFSNAEIVGYLLKRRADMTAVDMAGRNMLHMAARSAYSMQMAECVFSTAARSSPDSSQYKEAISARSNEEGSPTPVEELLKNKNLLFLPSSILVDYPCLLYDGWLSTRRPLISRLYSFKTPERDRERALHAILMLVRGGRICAPGQVLMCSYFDNKHGGVVHAGERMLATLFLKAPPPLSLSIFRAVNTVFQHERVRLTAPLSVRSPAIYWTVRAQRMLFTALLCIQRGGLPRLPVECLEHILDFAFRSPNLAPLVHPDGPQPKFQGVPSYMLPSRAIIDRVAELCSLRIP